MNRSTARGLAVSGATITVVSLLTPWYVLRAGALQGLGKSGAAALGVVSLLVLVLAIGAGWSAAARAHRYLPPLSAGLLVLIVLVKYVSPPTSASALSGAATNDPLATGFANAITTGLDVHYAPAWGIWLAAIGAAATLVGTIANALESSG